MPKDNAPECELWNIDRIAAFLGIGHESVRKALSRKGIKETRGYPADKVKAAWPDRGDKSEPNNRV